MRITDTLGADLVPVQVVPSVRSGNVYSSARGVDEFRVDRTESETEQIGWSMASYHRLFRRSVTTPHCITDSCPLLSTSCRRNLNGTSRQTGKMLTIRSNRPSARTSIRHNGVAVRGALPCQQ